MTNVEKRYQDLSAEVSAKRKALDQVRKSREQNMLSPAHRKILLNSAMMDFAPNIKTCRFLAQGDSWFNYWIGHDVLYWLQTDYGHTIDNIAVAGSTLNDVVYGQVPHDFLDFRQTDAPSRLAELVDRIKSDKPQALLISAGGNDIAGDEFFSFIDNAKSGLPQVNSTVLQGVVSQTFEQAYRILIETAIHAADKDGYSGMKIFTHGYDYPWPDGRGVVWIKGLIGPWFDASFKAKNYPCTSHSELLVRRGIVKSFIDGINVMLQSLSKDPAYAGRVVHIDARNTLTDEISSYADAWANELHPTNTGFQAIAKVFNDVIQKNMP